MNSWLLAARPKTLTAAIVPIVAATSLASFQSSDWSWQVLVLALCSAIFIQIGTNLVNDAVDFKKGADTNERIGPQRVTQSGLFSASQVMRAAGIIFLVALLCGIPLVIKGGFPIVIIGLISILMGYSYTSGPFPLAYLGLGDIFVVFFFGLVAVGGVYFLHTGTVTADCAILGLQIGLLSTVLIAINNLRDCEGDKKVGKKTLAVRFGKNFVRWEIFLLLNLPFVAGLYWYLVNGMFFAFLMPLFIFPLAVRISYLIFVTEPSPVYNKYLGMSALVHLLFGILFSIGVLL